MNFEPRGQGSRKEPEEKVREDHAEVFFGSSAFSRFGRVMIFRNKEGQDVVVFERS